MESELEDVDGDILPMREKGDGIRLIEGVEEEYDITHEKSCRKVIHDVPDAFNMFPVLPMEILAEVFSYLSLKELGLAAQVCTEWKRWVYELPLYRELDLHPFRRSLYDAELDAVLLRVRRLEHLRLTYCLNIEYLDNMMELIALRYSDSLLSVDLTDCSQLSDRGLQALEPCLKLRQLTLTGCKVSPAGMLRFAQECAAAAVLESVQISSIKGLKEKDIQKMRELLPKATINWRIEGAKTLFYMEPCTYSALRPLQYAKLSCKTGLRLRSFYRYIVLKLVVQGIADESKFAEDIIDITYRDVRLEPAVTLAAAVGSCHSETIVLRYRRCGETDKPRLELPPSSPKPKRKLTHRSLSEVFSERRSSSRAGTKEKNGCELM